MNNAVRIAATTLLMGLAGICGLIFSAARSDFTFRGCPDIPRSEWEATANCSDGWLGQVLFAGLAVILLASVVFVWRWRVVS